MPPSTPPPEPARSRWRSALAIATTATVVAGLLGTGLPAPATAATAGRGHDPSVTVTVDPDLVLQQDYLGVGANVMPFSLLPGTTGLGYDDAAWEADRERILTVRPKVARLWFQIDWMELEKGRYDFTSPEMQAVHRYLDVFREAGTEVELNFGWKVGERVHDWFGVSGADPWIAAPADLEAYGASAAALLDDLIRQRGYDNVKYLTFYNEPNGSWDFDAGGRDEKAYYAAMARAVHEHLQGAGLRDQVEIWGPEEVGAADWTAYMEENAGDVFDSYSFHLYGESYEAMAQAVEDRQAVAGGKPVVLSEFGWTSGDVSTWETGYANYVVRSAQEGVRANLVWQLNGTTTADPDGDTNGQWNLWDSLVLGPEPREAFYEAGLLMRYVPAHSEVLATTSSSPDVRATAFRRDGEYTVLVETAPGQARDVTVDFGDGAGVPKKFTRLVAEDDPQVEANALLPASTGRLTTRRGAFTDTELPAERTVAVYTSAPPATQVAVDPVQGFVEGGSSTRLSAELVDGRGGVRWSVLGTGGGTVDRRGVYTAPDVDTERTVALRAESVKDPDAYGIARLTVTPAPVAGRVDAPVLSLPPGQYDSVEAVTMTTGTPGAQIRYTTDGSEPTQESTPYTGPVFLDPGTTRLYRAKAFADGLEASGTTSRLYKVLDVQNAPDGYRFCAYEDGFRCEFKGTASVAYGSGRTFTYGTFTDGVECTAEAFGEDPHPGEQDRCFWNPTVPQEPPLVTLFNAGFERPATGSAANGPMVNGWTFTARAGVQHNDSAFVPSHPAPEGERTAYLKTDSGLAGSFEQEALFPEGTFQVRFEAAIRTGFGGPQTFDVLVDDEVVGSFAPPSGEYLEYLTEPFALPAGAHTITFAATTTEGDNTAFVDAVDVVRAP
ncbi:chitobiase/beta-hexosaminidase C-terminal domain-containing protein [Kineococcus esterisolvens]|uniref:chitobiase/beta-hexosaminidase C-terminal domain-containing protein n=1 Tax=unclassified Kineococcus TaxID=2621656 RepID=UPI003D7C9C6D